MRRPSIGHSTAFSSVARGLRSLDMPFPKLDVVSVVGVEPFKDAFYVTLYSRRAYLQLLGDFFVA